MLDRHVDPISTVVSRQDFVVIGCFQIELDQMTEIFLVIYDEDRFVGDGNQFPEDVHLLSLMRECLARPAVPLSYFESEFRQFLFLNAGKRLDPRAFVETLYNCVGVTLSHN